MSYDQKMLADAPAVTANRKMIAGAFVAVGLLVGLGLVANLNVWLLACLTAVAASGLAVLVWPPSRDERAAIAWWNGLTEPEREQWLDQSETGMHRDAWEAYKWAKHTCLTSQR